MQAFDDRYGGSLVVSLVQGSALKLAAKLSIWKLSSLSSVGLLNRFYQVCRLKQH